MSLTKSRAWLLLGMVVLIVPVTGTRAGGEARTTSPGITGDFNADGYADVAVGIPSEDVEGFPDAGAVAVLYGSPDGAQAENPPDQFLHQGETGIGETLEAKDRFGFSVCVGDFNGDGFSDLVVGVPREEVLREDGSRSVWHAGALHVLYGAESGLRTDPSAVQTWTQESSGIVGLAESGDEFGYAVAAGDFDGDGFDDLVAGVPFEDAGAETIPGAGAVNVLYGSALGLQSAGDQHLDQDDVDVEDAAERWDSLGWSVDVGDFDSDGFDDAAVGVPGEDVGEAADAGAVHALYGGAQGLQATAPDDQVWRQGAMDSSEQAEPRDAFGTAVATGDFDGDGFDDLAAGAPGEDMAVPDVGVVSVIYGSASGLQAVSPDDQVWSEDSPGVEGRAARGDRFGQALAAADFDGDGTADLVVGVPFKDVRQLGILNSGLVHVIYGSDAGLQTQGPLDQAWTQGGAVQDAAEAGDWFGAFLGAGDYNGDGLADLSVGIPSEDGAAPGAGAVAVLLAADGGLQATAPDDQLWDQDAPGLEDQSEPSDGFGSALT